MTDQHVGNRSEVLEPFEDFVRRHVGPSDEEQEAMLKVLGYETLDALVDAAVPGSVRSLGTLDLPPAVSEHQVLDELRRLADENTIAEPMIGLGYSGTITPGVIRRNVLESPAWYTAYTPYQPEISQGRLEALLNFQTMVTDLTGLDTANASLLDESTAVAEAVTLMRRRATSESNRVIVDADCLPQTIAVLATRLGPLGLTLDVVDLGAGAPAGDYFGVVQQYPGCSGSIRDFEALTAEAHAKGALVTVAADLLALTLLKPPGEWGADVVVGSSQRFGVPLWYGGPHAAFMAVKAGLERDLPGRLVGLSIDAEERPAYRLALQTREQHIRREKATSNICTAQVLLAVVASMYAVYHGAEGLRGIARRVHRRTVDVAAGLRQSGFSLVHRDFFDTVVVEAPRPGGGDRRRCPRAWGAAPPRRRGPRRDLVRRDDHRGPRRRRARGLRGRRWGSGRRRGPARGAPAPRADPGPPRLLRAPLRDGHVALSAPPLGPGLRARPRHDPPGLVHHEAERDDRDGTGRPARVRRHPSVRAAREHARATCRSSTSWRSGWPASRATPRCPSSPTRGARESWPGSSPSRPTTGRGASTSANVCLIPSSAHGTNAASAVMAGMRVVVVAALDDGTVDLEDLRRKCEEHSERLAAIMVTYPSTHGVYEEGISDMCALVHQHGGQVYIDGANLNALLGLAKPGQFGGDVSHLNLHKTFCIPHGGGGPGVGPVAVAEHLVPFLPSHPLHPRPAAA